MSYILDALKKSEEERERGAVPKLTTNLGTDPTTKRRMWPWVIGAALMANAAVLGVFLWPSEPPPASPVETAAAGKVAEPVEKAEGPAAPAEQKAAPAEQKAAPAEQKAAPAEKQVAPKQETETVVAAAAPAKSKPMSKPVKAAPEPKPMAEASKPKLMAEAPKPKPMHKPEPVKAIPEPEPEPVKTAVAAHGIFCIPESSKMLETPAHLFAFGPFAAK